MPQFKSPTYRPERPKGSKDKVKRLEGPPARNWARRAPRLLVLRYSYEPATFAGRLNQSYLSNNSEL